MSIQNASNGELELLVKWSPRFCDEAQRELERRAALNHAAAVEQDAREVRALAGEVFPKGRWTT